MDFKSGVILQLYARAKAPSRDYFGLTIRESEVLLNTWNISHGPHTFPKKHRCSLEELELAQPLLDDILRLFGAHVLNFVQSLGRGAPKLECLPTHIFCKILHLLGCNDIIKLSQTSKILHELCNRNDIWEIIFGKRNRGRASKDELRAAQSKGWKVVLKNKIVWHEHLKKKPVTALGLREPSASTSALLQAKKAYESKLKSSAAAKTSDNRLEDSKSKSCVNQDFLEVTRLQSSAAGVKVPGKPKPVPQFRAKQRISREALKLEPRLEEKLHEIATESVALTKSTEDLLQADLEELQAQVAAANDLILAQIRSGERNRPPKPAASRSNPKGILKKPTIDFKTAKSTSTLLGKHANVSKEQKQVDEISRYVDARFGLKSSAQRSAAPCDLFSYAQGDYEVNRNGRRVVEDEDVMRSNFEQFLSSRGSKTAMKTEPATRPICSQMIPSVSELRKSISTQLQASPAKSKLKAQNNTKIANKSKQCAQLNNKSNIISASTSALEMKRNSLMAHNSKIAKNTNCQSSSTSANKTKSHAGLRKSAAFNDKL